MNAPRILLALASLAMLQGCIAAALAPLAAGGMIVRSAVTGERSRQALVEGTTLDIEALGDDIFADLSIVKAWKADETGNIVFRKTARNFNQPAATCGKVCVAEVEEIVKPGELDPDGIHLPGVFINRLIVGAPYDKKIEFITTRERAA